MKVLETTSEDGEENFYGPGINTQQFESERVESMG